MYTINRHDLIPAPAYIKLPKRARRTLQAHARFFTTWLPYHPHFDKKKIGSNTNAATKRCVFGAAKTYEQKAGFPASLIQRGWKLTFCLPGAQIWTFLASGELSERSARSSRAFLSDVLTHSTAHACSQIVIIVLRRTWFPRHI